LQTSVGNNGASTTANLLVNPGQPPSVSKSFAPTTIVAGQQSTLTISLGNGNSSAATLTVALVDTLPAQLTVASPAAVTGTCPDLATNVVAAPGAGTVTYAAGAQIPAGGCSFQVRVTSATAGGPYTNTIPVGALQTNLGNNAVATNANLTVTSNAPGNVASLSGTVYMTAMTVAPSTRARRESPEWKSACCKTGLSWPRRRPMRTAGTALPTWCLAPTPWWRCSPRAGQTERTPWAWVRLAAWVQLATT